ncbi:Glycerophosphocholine phosphodiesterase [Agyrium rufum]|nr:Glycerophosphocholine phosphodiesterase [Agyrium rufum]
MKFGRQFPQHQVPEWAEAYTNYNLLKSLFKASIIHWQRDGVKLDLTEFLDTYNQEVRVVESFYEHRSTLLREERASLLDQHGIADLTEVVKFVGVDDAEEHELLVSLEELLAGLKALQRYGEVNKAAFRSILAKWHRFGVSNNVRGYKDVPLQEFSLGSLEEAIAYDMITLEMALKALTVGVIERVPSTPSSSSVLSTVILQMYASPGISESPYAAITEDSTFALDRFFEDSAPDTLGSKYHQLLLALLRSAIIQNARSCIKTLLQRLQSVHIPEHNGSTVLQGLRTCLVLPRKMRTQTSHGSRQERKSAELAHSEKSFDDMEQFLLARMGPNELKVLSSVDIFGHSVLHDAASHGLAGVCEIYLRRMQEQSSLPNSMVLETTQSPDIDGRTPLFLAVAMGHSDVAELLLTCCSREISNPGNVAQKNNLQSTLDRLLPIAIKSNVPDTVALLLSHHADPGFQGPNGETALYLAAQLGHGDHVTKMLECLTQAPNALDLREHSRDWTPLIIACVEGLMPVVKILIDAGADITYRDRFDWTAQEHAAFRGHLEIASLLNRINVAIQREQTLTPSWSWRSPQWNYSGNNIHHVFITLGSPNTRDKTKAIKLCSHLTDKSDLGIGCSVELIASEKASSSGRKVYTPALAETIYDPWHITVRDPPAVRLRFNVYETVSENAAQLPLIGSGVMLIQNLRPDFAAGREGLARYHSVPLLAKDSLDFVGTITFGLLLVTPGPHAPVISPQSTGGFWKDNGSTQVVGHRGSGANTAGSTKLQLGENTIQSFLSAKALGASCVEFDVQLTKDLVPVIFHDFLVMEAGGDTPLYTMNFNQFLHLSEAQASRGDISTAAESRYRARATDQSEDVSLRPRSHSLSTYDDSRSVDLAQRMKHTESAIEGAHKGNLRGQCVQEVFPTFEDLLNRLPQSIAFNVEMKYPMLWEAEDRHMDPFAPEINTYIDLVLDQIYRLAGERSITFSSFSPEVCIALSIKQQHYPVLFLSKSGSVPVGDVRCSSLQQSIHFAKRYNLAGIVMFSDPLITCPRLIRYAKSAGLRVCSYGPQNNVPEYAKIQATAGLDVIIVDQVRLIAETLANFAT